MLISVSGRIGSGKDTVGMIAQAIISFPTASNASISRILLSGIDNPSAKIKKWADKLKDIVCLLLNCTREQLEDHTFKSKELGKEWWYFAETVTHNKIPYLENREVLLDKFPVWKLTPRLLLQLLGTECGRQIIHPNIWINSLMSEYKPAILENLHVPGDYVGRCLTCDKPFLGAKRSTTCKNCESRVEKYPTWIITDTRFPNELKAIEDRGGITIVVRRTKPKCGCVSRDIMQCDVDCDDSVEVLHESETALDNATFDYAINNYGTMEELIEQVRQILILEKIV